MIKAFYHPGYAAPLGDHIMPIRKFGMVADKLRDFAGVKLDEPDPVTGEDLRRVHTTKYIEAVKTGEPRRLAEMQKFPWSKELYPSVCLTSGGCLAAARVALEDGVAAAVVSGFHHSCADHGEGFCTFNGLIVTLDKLFAERRIGKAAILDMDLHYGNGTAQLAVARPDIFALSIYGCDYVENVSYDDVEVRRHQDGVNHRSFELLNGCDQQQMVDVMSEALPLLVEDGAPDLLLYQAGADPYYEDPYSRLRLDHAALKLRDRMVFEFAAANGISIAWVLAGGYTKDTSKVVEVHMNTFRVAREVYG